MPAPLPIEKQAEIVALLEAGHTPTAVAEKACVAKPSVYAVARKDKSGFVHLVNAIKRAHADDCYAVAAAIRDDVWQHIGKIPVKTAGDLRNLAVSSAVFIDKALAIEGKAPGQGPSAFNLYLSGDRSAAQVNISPVEAKNIMVERQERAEIERAQPPIEAELSE